MKKVTNKFKKVQIEKELIDKNIITILTALDMYFEFCNVIKKDKLEELKKKVMNLVPIKNT